MGKLLHLFVLFLGLIVSLTGACSPGSGDREWLRPRESQQTSTIGWHQLSTERVKAVPAKHLEKAISLLSETSFRELTAQEIDLFEIDKEVVTFKTPVYLVRAVSNVGTARVFTILIDDNAIVVHQGSLAEHATLQKDAVIVTLERAPSDVFIEVDIAQ